MKGVEGRDWSRYICCAEEVEVVPHFCGKVGGKRRSEGGGGSAANVLRGVRNNETKRSENERPNPNYLKAPPASFEREKRYIGLSLIHI